MGDERTDDVERTLQQRKQFCDGRSEVHTQTARRFRGGKYNARRFSSDMARETGPDCRTEVASAQVRKESMPLTRRTTVWCSLEAN
jgi:hypothetical protein